MHIFPSKQSYANRSGCIWLKILGDMCLCTLHNLYCPCSRASKKWTWILQSSLYSTLLVLWVSCMTCIQRRRNIEIFIIKTFFLKTVCRSLKFILIIVNFFLEMMAVHQSKNMTVAKGIYRRFVSKPQIEKAFVV